MIAVEAHNLRKEYPVAVTNPWRLWRACERRRTVALDGVSLAVPQGEIFGLLGPNGAGKTTLINILSTLVTPTSGTAKVEGLDVRMAPITARRMIGLVTSNERSFYWRLTGRQNLEFFADLYHVPPAESRQRIIELIDTLDLSPFADRRFDSYSTGIRQRFAFARALLHRPRILFMDEPTKGLDPEAAAALMGMIRERIAGVWRPTIIATSHNLREIEQLCSRVAIMHRGRLLRCGTLDELRQTVATYETYRLTVGGLGERVLDAIRLLPGVGDAQAVERDGLLQLDVQLEEGGEALSRVLRKVLAGGAEIRACQQIPVSLVDVFHHVVSGNGEA